LGFLPGDLQEKINPYLRPLYDALYDLMDAERVVRLIERGSIEIAPIAFMRGRTLNDSFIILDEAQNTTSEQMKMFLTRIGFGSKTVVTGDITQIDLPPGKTRPMSFAIASFSPSFAPMSATRTGKRTREQPPESPIERKGRSS
jgi:phosphate starvation-inducible PhoH-like protein